jgi:hypothetical protein
MSFDEMSSLLNAENERLKGEFERDRIKWFYTVTATGLSRARKPSDLITFEWEKGKREIEPKKMTKEQFNKKAKEAEKYLKM